jgi:hypothetical protein
MILAGLSSTVGVYAYARTPFGVRRSDGLILIGNRHLNEENDTARLQRAIDAAHTLGGGTVQVPPGVFVCGTIQLRSHVSLWLDNGAQLKMSSNAADFLPLEQLPYDPKADTGTADFHRALLVCDGSEQIAIYGEGVLQGPGPEGAEPKAIAMRRCRSVSIRGITIREAANYGISMLGCEFVVIDGVTLQKCSSDGIDPDCCRSVQISNCNVESVDDAICLKSSGSLGELRATEGVTIENCILKTASIHFKCGTESCGDFRGITVTNCVFQGGMGMRHGNPGIGLYTTDGGALTDVLISDIVMRDVGTPIAIIRGNRDRCGRGAPGVIDRVRITNILAKGAKLPSVIVGLPNAPVGGISIAQFSVTMASSGDSHRGLNEIPEKPSAYPEPTMFGSLPACGLFLRHVTDLQLGDFEISSVAEETRSIVIADDVRGLRLAGFRDYGGGQRTFLWLRNVRDSNIKFADAAAIPDGSCRIEGAETSNLVLRGDDATFKVERIAAISGDVHNGAIKN